MSMHSSSPSLNALLRVPVLSAASSPLCYARGHPRSHGSVLGPSSYWIYIWLTSLYRISYPLALRPLPLAHVDAPFALAFVSPRPTLTSPRIHAYTYNTHCPLHCCRRRLYPLTTHCLFSSSALCLAKPCIVREPLILVLHCSARALFAVVDQVVWCLVGPSY